MGSTCNHLTCTELSADRTEVCGCGCYGNVGHMCWRYGEGTCLRDAAKKSGNLVVKCLKTSSARAGL